MSDPVKLVPPVLARLTVEQRAKIAAAMRIIVDALTPEERAGARRDWGGYWAQAFIDAIGAADTPPVPTRRYCTFCGNAFGMTGVCDICKPAVTP